MGWIGKVVGGAIGMAIGGPLGAVLGATFGHAYDKNVEIEENLQVGGGPGPRRESLSSGEQSQATFFVACFSMLAKIARADGQVTRDEIDSIERFMLQDLRLDPHSRGIAMNIFNTAMNSPESFEAFADQFYKQFRNQPQLLELMIDILLRVSVADGTMSASEEMLVQAAVRTFRFSDARYATLKRRYVDDSDRYYAILGCRRSDSEDVIKSAYRKLVQEYHPTRLPPRGCPRSSPALPTRNSARSRKPTMWLKRSAASGSGRERRGAPAAAHGTFPASMERRAEPTMLA
jgi:DnaJ like chaperone protein